jgi:DHA1 family tetracycline resistance protein-like MFS transporter
MLRLWRSERSALILVTLTVLIDFIGFGLIYPIFPFWAEHIGANAFVIGLFIAVHALAQCMFMPILGMLSDRYGRRSIIIATLLIETLSLILTVLARNLPLLILARFIAGAGASRIGSAQTVVTDVTPPQQRTQGMGLLGAAFGMGMIIGPPLGGLLASIRITLPFWVAAGVLLINALLVTLFLPETRKIAPAQAQTLTTHTRWHILPTGWRKMYRSPAITRLMAVDLLFALAFATIISVFALFTEHHFGWKAKQVGYTFTYLGIISVIMQGGLIGWLAKRLGEQKLLLLGLCCLAGGLLALSLSRSVAFMLLALGVLHVGEGVARPSITALFSFASPADMEGETLGIAQGVGSLGNMIGPMLAGSCYLLAGSRIPFMTGGAFVVVAALLLLPPLPAIIRQSVRT